MELFRLTCVTCQARLSVRDQVAIGKILSCPSCGSMVQVTAPDAWVAENSPNLQHPASRLPSPIPRPQPPGPSLTSQGDLPMEVPNKPGRNGVPGGFRLRAIAWSLAGTVTAGIMVAILVGPFGKGAADSPATGSPAIGSQTVPAHSAIQPQSVSQHELATPLENSVSSEADVSVDSPMPIVLTADDLVGDTLPPLSGEPPVPGETKASAKNTEVDSVEAVGHKPEVQAGQHQLSLFDPLDLDPEGFDMASLGRIRLGRQEGITGLSDRPAESGELQSRLPSGGPKTTGLAPGEQVADAKPLAPESLNTQVVRMDPATVVPAEMPSAEEQLTQRLAAIEIDRMPLHAFLELISGLGNVPIQLGPEVLRMAAISAEASVSVRRQQTSMAEALRAGLRPLHLDYRAVGSLVIIHWPGAERRREIDYPIADLVTPETDARQIADWIHRLVAPSSWQVAGGEGNLQIADDTLRIVQTQRVQYQVLCFLERLRLVRKLKLRSRYPLERLAVESAYQQVAESLNGQALFNFSRYTPLSEIFSYWRQQLGLALLVDWSALLGESSELQQKPLGRPQVVSIGPATRIACAVVDQPWHQALDTVLEPLGLAWRAIDGGELQITSALVAQEAAQLEIYPLVPEGPQGLKPLDLDKAAVVARMAELQRLTEESNSTMTSHSRMALILDPVSQHLLALQPSNVQRRLWQRIYTIRPGR